MALCYLQPLVKRLHRVCVQKCLHVYVQVYVHGFLPVCMCVFMHVWCVQCIRVCVHRGYHYAMSVLLLGSLLQARALWYVFRAISEQIYWLIIVKQVQWNGEIYERYIRVPHSVVFEANSSTYACDKQGHTQNMSQNEETSFCQTTKKNIIPFQNELKQLLSGEQTGWILTKSEADLVKYVSRPDGKHSEQCYCLLATGTNVWWWHRAQTAHVYHVLL